MFLVEMFHFTGEKERKIKEIFKRAGYLEGPEIFPDMKVKISKTFENIFFSNMIYIEREGEGD